MLLVNFLAALVIQPVALPQIDVVKVSTIILFSITAITRYYATCINRKVYLLKLVSHEWFKNNCDSYSHTGSQACILGNINPMGGSNNSPLEALIIDKAPRYL